MIIWIASYPKSGNTWVRAFLSYYFFSKEKKFNFDDLKHIPNFNISAFINNKELIKGNLDIIKNWLPTQKFINQKYKRNLFFKTHNANININGNNFTDKTVTGGCIYIVRDPRNVITSYKNFENKSYENMIKLMLNKKGFLYSDSLTMKKFGIKGLEILCSWADHYNSWAHNKQKIPICLIRYEDLVNNTLGEFKKIFNFIKKVNKEKNTEFDEIRAKHVINEVSFENLKQKELADGFIENSERRDKFNTFFNQGNKNNWENLLPQNIKEKLETNFKNEMIELGYLKKN